MSVRIAPFQPGQETQVVGLILPIQREEFLVPITAADQALRREAPSTIWVASTPLAKSSNARGTSSPMTEW